MAWRKNSLFLALAIVLSACSFPIQISLFSRETPAAESKDLTALATESFGATNPPQVSSDKKDAPQAPYAVQAGTPVGVVNFIDPAAGCNWMGVGGQVFSLDAEPVVDLVATLGGILGGKQLSQLAVTGGAQALGPGGYLIELGNQPVASQGTLWLQLFDQDGVALSDKVFFNTYSGCDQNLILINFAERFTIQSSTFLPFVGNEKLFYYFPFVGQK